MTIRRKSWLIVRVNLLKKYQCIPFELDPYNANILHLAMADPMDMAAIDDISIVTNLQVEPYIATPRDILAASTAAARCVENMDAARRLHVNESSFVEMWKRQQRPMSVMPRSYSWYVP